MVNKTDTVRYTEDELDDKLRRGEDRTDWARVDSLTEAELEASIDLQEEGEVDWASATIELPRPKQLLTMRYDPGVIEWFKAQGPGYQSRINAVLKQYIQAHSK